MTVASRTVSNSTSRMRSYLKPVIQRCLLTVPSAPIASYLARHISPVQSTKDPPRPDAPTILALSPNKFRRDLQILADTGQFRVHALDGNFQMRIVSQFRSAPGSYREYCAADPDPHQRRSRQRASKIWLRILPNLISRFRIKAVIGAAAHYHQDWDIGTAAERLGIPYIVLHRENSFVAAPATKQEVMKRMKYSHPFTGRLIIMHNSMARQCLIDSGYVKPDAIVSIGCLRMDEWVRWCEGTSQLGTDAVFFSFAYSSGMIGRNNYSTDGKLGFVRLFKQAHIAFAELARDNPTSNFTVKIKYGLSDHDAVLAALASAGIDPQLIPNYRITQTEEAQDLIRGAAVVVGFQSTTILEAALAARLVVIPAFAEAARADHKPYLRFGDAYDLFKVAESPEKLKTLVLDRLMAPRLETERLKERRALFEKYVSSLSADTVDSYVQVLRDLCVSAAV
jgi:hypothetical protein